MKTMKKGNECIRVQEDAVARFLKNGWTFCPKAEWKAMKPPKK